MHDARTTRTITVSITTLVLFFSHRIITTWLSSHLLATSHLYVRSYCRNRLRGPNKQPECRKEQYVNLSDHCHVQDKQKRSVETGNFHFFLDFVKMFRTFGGIDTKSVKR